VKTEVKELLSDGSSADKTSGSNSLVSEGDESDALDETIIYQPAAPGGSSNQPIERQPLSESLAVHCGDLTTQPSDITSKYK